MKKIIIMLVMLAVFFSGCGPGDPWEAVEVDFYVTNDTSSLVFIGNFVRVSQYSSERKTFIVGIPANSRWFYRTVDTEDQLGLYSANWDLALATSLREVGFCMYSSEITNQTNIFSYSYFDDGWGVYEYCLDTADDPTNQVIPSSLIYRMQITTNEGTNASGRYSWEIETNTRPFYLVRPTTNNRFSEVVITSIMTNVTN